MKYDPNDRVLGSNLILSFVNVFVRMPFVVKDMGVIIPKMTGTQVGVNCKAFYASISASVYAALPTTPDKLITMVHATILHIPIIW